MRESADSPAENVCCSDWEEYKAEHGCEFEDLDFGASCTTTTTSTTSTTTTTITTTIPQCNYQEKLNTYCARMEVNGEGEFKCSRAKHAVGPMVARFGPNKNGGVFAWR